MATKIKLKQLEDGTSGQLIQVNGSGVPVYVGQNTINISGFTNDSGYITSAALSPYLTSATAAATYLTIANAASTYQPIGSYQPLSTNLTSLSGLTYASASFVKMTAAGTFALDTNTYLTSSTGVTTVNGLSGAITNVALTTGTLAQFAATTSAQLAGVISDETGSGALVFGTSPVFTTNITTPSIVFTGNISSASWTTTGVKFIGGGSTLTNTTSSGTIATTYTNVHGGNTIVSNSATTYTDYYGSYFKPEIQGSGSTFINNYAAGYGGQIRIDQGSAKTIIGEQFTGGYSGIWFNTSSPTASNYNVSSNGANYIMNASTALYYRIANNDIVSCLSTGFTWTDSKHLIFGTSSGSKIGTGTNQKIGFWNATPVVQPTTAVATSTFVANTSGIVDDSATFGGYKISQIVKALQTIGLLA